MGDYKPLLYTLGFILVVGFLFVLIASPFVEPSSVQTTGIMNSTIDLIDNGYNFTINIPILPDVSGTLPFPLPTTFKQTLTENLTYFGLIPSRLQILLITLCFISLSLGIIVLILP